MPGIPVTEANWYSPTSLHDYLWYVCGAEPDETGRPFHSPVFDRKCRLIALGALRAVWNHIPDARCREAIELAEQFADDLDMSGLRRAVGLAREAWEDSHLPDGDGFVAWTWEGLISDVVCLAVSEDFCDADPEGPAQFIRHTWANILDEIQAFPIHPREAARAFHFALFHDIVSNPFRPVAVDPSWLTSTVVTLAEGMYESRDFAAMPILADALQDAGCGHPDVLEHCQSPGPHVRGCWVIDLLLGKT